MKAALSKKAKIVIFAALALVICAAAGFAFFKAKPAVKERSEKPLIKLEYMWPYIDFDRAVEKAVTIVYGKVIDISETKLHETVMSDGDMHQEYYKDITLEVISLLKGESTNSTVIYKEMTGEADDCIYGIVGYEDLSLDDEILLFANKHGAFLAPEAIIPVVDGVIDPDNLMRPENISNMRSGEINVFDYLDAVEEKLK